MESQSHESQQLFCASINTVICVFLSHYLYSILLPKYHACYVILGNALWGISYSGECSYLVALLSLRLLGWVIT